MSPIILGVLSIPFMLVLLLSEVPVAISLGVTAFLGLWLITGGFDLALGILSVTSYLAIASFAYTALPLFILMGVFAGRAGIAEGAYRSAEKWVGRFPGGLAMATVAANAAFGAACGSSAAACAVFTKFSLPEMVRAGYRKEFACCIVAASGVLSMLVPPSILMIIYGIMTETSIGGIFIAGIGPGITLSLLYGIGIWVMVTRAPGLAGTVQIIRAGWKEMFYSLRQLWGIMVLMFLVLGGIYLGIFTPAEAGALGALGAFVLVALARKLTLRTLWDTLLESARTTAMVYFIVIGAMLYSKLLSISGLTGAFGEWVTAAGLPPVGMLGAIIVFYLIGGTILSSIPLICVTLPITYPICLTMGWDPLWFAIVVILATEIGLLTPPVGINAFVVKAAAGPDVTIEAIFKGLIPFFILMLVALGLVVAVPSIAVWLPHTMQFK